MKISYLITALAFALGLGFLIWGTSSSDEVTLLGVTFHPRIAKSVGLITMLLSVITILALFGSSLPPNEAERRREATLSEMRDRYRTMEDRDGAQRTHATESPRAGRFANENGAQEKISRPTKYTA
jgi:hypothetical protein